MSRLRKRAGADDVRRGNHRRLRRWCGGIWFDRYELASIRTEFVSEKEREQAAQRYFSELFDAELAVAHKETQEDLARTRKVAICSGISARATTSSASRTGRLSSFQASAISKDLLAAVLL